MKSYFSKKIFLLFGLVVAISGIIYFLYVQYYVKPLMDEFITAEPERKQEISDKLQKVEYNIFGEIERLILDSDTVTFPFGVELLKNIDETYFDITYLDKNHPDTTRLLNIARLQDTLSFIPMIEMMNTADNSTLGSVVRALGVLGNKNAVSPIVELVKTNWNDSKNFGMTRKNNSAALTTIKKLDPQNPILDVLEERIKNSGILTDSRDGKQYKIVIIGNQIWMAENIAYHLAKKGVYLYEDNMNNQEVYGLLYTWENACDVCPDGWHLPSDIEWQELEIYLGMSKSKVGSNGSRGRREADMIKASSGWESKGNGNNKSGFTALPAGAYNYYGDFDDLGSETTFWTSTEKTNKKFAIYRRLFYDESKIKRDDAAKVCGYSVRCIEDAE